MFIYFTSNFESKEYLKDIGFRHKDEIIEICEKFSIINDMKTQKDCIDYDSIYFYNKYIKDAVPDYVYNLKTKTLNKIDLSKIKLSKKSDFDYLINREFEDKYFIEYFSHVFKNTYLTDDFDHVFNELPEKSTQEFKEFFKFLKQILKEYYNINNKKFNDNVIIELIGNEYINNHVKSVKDIIPYIENGDILIDFMYEHLIGKDCLFTLELNIFENKYIEQRDLPNYISKPLKVARIDNLFMDTIDNASEDIIRFVSENLLEWNIEGTFLKDAKKIWLPVGTLNIHRLGERLIFKNDYIKLCDMFGY